MSEAFSLPVEGCSTDGPPAMLDLLRGPPQLGLAPGGLGNHLQPIDGVPDASLKGASFLSQSSEIPEKTGT